MLKHGVNGIFLKNNLAKLLAEAIHKVVAGEVWLDPRYLDAAAEDSWAVFARRAKFPERDRQVLRWVFEGTANKEMAERLHVSKSAIKASLEQLFSKTGVRTRSHRVRVAQEHYRRSTARAG